MNDCAVAGIIIGPGTPGFVTDIELAGQLAEIGAILLMFGVGLHFSFDDLLSVRRIAVPGAIVQILAATALGMSVASFWGWSIGAALVFGLSLSCASTVVLLRAFVKHGGIPSPADSQCALTVSAPKNRPQMELVAHLPATRL